MRLLIAASGTGGHLFPALAVAERFSDAHIEWLGVPDRLEAQLIPQHYPLHTVALAGWQSGSRWQAARLPGQAMVASARVWRLLGRQQIDAVLTTGGYIAAPAILAARLRGIPVVLHESNALPGKVTRWLAPFCTTVVVGVSSAQRWLPRARTIATGTPVRAEFEAPQPLDLALPEGAPTVVAMGGSQGAVALNQLIRQCVPAWCQAGATVVHLTGDRDPDANSLQHPGYWALPFYERMAALLQRAELAIARAGAVSLSELAATHTPAILIPLPHAAEDHQAHNAQAWVDAGAGLMYRQNMLHPQRLQSQVLALIRSPQQRQAMAEHAATLAPGDSAARLAEAIREAALVRQ